MTVINLMRECLEIEKVARVDNVLQLNTNSWWFIATTDQLSWVPFTDRMGFEARSDSIWESL